MSPLLGVWRGDVVRIYNGAIIRRNVLTLRIPSARVGSTFRGEIPSPPGCTATFRIAQRLPAAWIVPETGAYVVPGALVPVEIDDREQRPRELRGIVGLLAAHRLPGWPGLRGALGIVLDRQVGVGS